MFKESTQREDKGCGLPSPLALPVRQEVTRKARQGRAHFHGPSTHGRRQTEGEGGDAGRRSLKRERYLKAPSGLNEGTQGRPDLAD